MTLRVGLTGGLASGKTTVAGMFASRGAYVLYADKVAHELMKPGQPVYARVVEQFGRDILSADSTINRARLAEIAFGRQRINELNRLIHPEVVARIQNWMDEMSEFDPGAILLVEAALILEAGLGKYFDKLVVVTSDEQQKLDRFSTRAAQAAGAGDERPAATSNEHHRASAVRDAERRLGAQLSQAEKVAAADYVIDNSGTLAETERQVAKLYKELQQLAAANRR